MVEPDKYINNVYKFERGWTIKNQHEIYETYTIIPNEHRNEFLKPFKMSTPLTHAMGKIIPWKTDIIKGFR